MSCSFQSPQLKRVLTVLIAVILTLASCQTAPPATIQREIDPTASIKAPVLSLETEGGHPSPTVMTPTPSPPPTIPATPSPTVVLTAIPAGKIIMPILLYHHVSDQGSGRYAIPVEVFREQMEALKAEGYSTITISQFADAIRSGMDLPERAVAITFDDGYLDTYVNAFPILHEMSYTATVYVITGTLGTKLSYGYMQAGELKALVAAGWEIGSHSVSHTDLRKTKLGAGNELKQSKQALEDILGIKVYSFSYPFGVADTSLKDLAAAAGYESAVGIGVYNTHTAEGLYFLSRREVYRSMPIWTFKKLLEPSEADHILATQSAAATATSIP